MAVVVAPPMAVSLAPPAEPESPTSSAGQEIDDNIFEVVGGAGKGGIIVRSERDVASERLEERLATGAIVRVLEGDGERFHYEKLAGDGPASGWVSARLQGKDLLARVSARSQGLAWHQDEALRLYCERFGFARGDTVRTAFMPRAGKDGMMDRQRFSWLQRQQGFEDQQKQPPRFHTLALLEQDLGLEAGALTQESLRDEQGAPQPELLPTFLYAGSLDRKPHVAKFDVRDWICERTGGFTHGQVVRDQSGQEYVVVGVKKVNGLPHLFFQPLFLDRKAAGAFPNVAAQTLKSRLAVVQGAVRQLEPARLEDYDAEEDSDGEAMLLCPHCRLPVGETGYVDRERGSSRLLHGECMAQVILKELESGDAERLRKDAEQKRERREKFDIGWAVARIPRNLGPAAKLGCNPLPKGMCCLVLSEDGRSLRAAATLEPAASVNLEYLSIALQVRRRHGREPLFSLDPVLSKEDNGDAKPHYKDLMQVKRFEPDWLRGTSLGEVMFQADYHLKELSMGEYEQPVVGMKSCHDMCEAEGDDEEWRAREWFVVRKAEVQLSEDGVLVPFVRMGVEAREQIVGPEGRLQDAQITRPNHPLVRYAEAFTKNFDLIAERKSIIYQLREVAKASVLAKFLIDSKISLEDSWFELAESPREDCVLEIPQLWNERSKARIEVKDGAIVNADKDLVPKMRGVYGGVEFGLDKTPTPIFGLTLPRVKLTLGRLLHQDRGWVVDPLVVSAQPKGVDLSLEKFDLSEARRVGGEKQLVAWSGDMQATDACSAMGLSFWKIIDGPCGNMLRPEDAQLLRDVFNPHLSDRRREGELFVPPDGGFAYINRLRGLVKDEEAVRRKRTELFLSESFCASEPGPFFPNSWSAGFDIARRQGEAAAKAPARAFQPGALQALQARPDYKAQASVMFEHVLRTAKPCFDKSTEDGLRFRIYRAGSLEVRTTQAPGEDEVIGEVFSVLSLRKPFIPGWQALGSSDKFVKVTEYVEQAGFGSAKRRSYIVLETKHGNVVVTEKLADGTVTWDENPKDLEDRNSLAKAVRSGSCSITVQGMQRYQLREAELSRFGASSGERKRYAQGAYCWASGQTRSHPSGYGKPAGGGRWQLLSAAVRGGAAEKSPQPAP